MTIDSYEASATEKYHKKNCQQKQSNLPGLLKLKTRTKHHGMAYYQKERQTLRKWTLLYLAISLSIGHVTADLGVIPLASELVGTIDSTVFLVCSSSAKPILCLWKTPYGHVYTLSEGVFAESGRLRHKANASSDECGLEIVGLQHKDEGRWECEIGSLIEDTFQTATAKINLQVKRQSQTFHEGQTSRQEVGNDVILHCSADREVHLCRWRTPYLNTYIVGEGIYVERGRIQWLGKDPNFDCTIRVANLDLRDAGTWVCEIGSSTKESFQVQTKEFVIDIETPLKLSAPTALMQNANMDATLVCHANKPYDKCLWTTPYGQTYVFLDQNSSHEGGRIAYFGFADTDCGVIVRNVQPKDNGGWQCQLHSRNGDIFQNASDLVSLFAESTGGPSDAIAQPRSIADYDYTLKSIDYDASDYIGGDFDRVQGSGTQQTPTNIQLISSSDKKKETTTTRSQVLRSKPSESSFNLSDFKATSSGLLSPIELSRIPSIRGSSSLSTGATNHSQIEHTTSSAAPLSVLNRDTSSVSSSEDFAGVVNQLELELLSRISGTRRDSRPIRIGANTGAPQSGQRQLPSNLINAGIVFESTKTTTSITTTSRTTSSVLDINAPSSSSKITAESIRQLEIQRIRDERRKTAQEKQERENERLKEAFVASETMTTKEQATEKEEMKEKEQQKQRQLIVERKRLEERRRKMELQRKKEAEEQEKSRREKKKETEAEERQRGGEETRKMNTGEEREFISEENEQMKLEEVRQKKLKQKRQRELNEEHHKKNQEERRRKIDGEGNRTDAKDKQVIADEKQRRLKEDKQIEFNEEASKKKMNKEMRQTVEKRQKQIDNEQRMKPEKEAVAAQKGRKQVSEIEKRIKEAEEIIKIREEEVDLKKKENEDRKRQQEVQRRREEARKQRQAELKKQRENEKIQKELQEKRRKEEDQRKKAMEAQRLEEEKKRQAEEDQRRREAEIKRRLEIERKRKENEEKRLAEIEKKRQEDLKKEREILERRRKEEEERLMREIEKKKKAEEEKRKAEAERKAKEEAEIAKKFEDIRQREEIEKKRLEEVKREEVRQKRIERQRQRDETERQRKLEAEKQRKEEEEKQKRLEEKKMKENERRQKADLLKKQRDEERRKSLERIRQERIKGEQEESRIAKQQEDQTRRQREEELRKQIETERRKKMEDQQRQIAGTINFSNRQPDLDRTSLIPRTESPRSFPTSLIGLNLPGTELEGSNQKRCFINAKVVNGNVTCDNHVPDAFGEYSIGYNEKCDLSCKSGYVSVFQKEALCQNGRLTPRLDCVRPDALLLLAGRSDTHGVLNTVELVTNRGVCRGAVPTLPAMRWRMIAQSIDKETVLACGGVNIFGDPKKHCWILGFAQEPFWSEAPHMLVARDAAAWALEGNFLIVLGGSLGKLNGYTDSVEMHNVKSRQWIQGPQMSSSRYSHCAVGLGNGSIIVTGGYGGLDQVERLDIDTGKWWSLPELNPVRAQHGCAIVDLDGEQGVLVVGGDSGGTRLKDVRFLPLRDPASGWRKVADLNTARWGRPGVAMVGGRITVAAGWDGVRDLATVEYYDEKTKRWRLTASRLQFERRWPASTPISLSLFPKCAQKRER